MPNSSSTLRFGDGITGLRPDHSKSTGVGHSPEWSDQVAGDPGSTLRPDFGAGLNDLVFAPLAPAKADASDSHDRYANLETAYLLDAWSPLEM
ncbi:MAG: hypothetical protein AAGE13_00545 [Pseudomonadota bacterium]